MDIENTIALIAKSKILLNKFGMKIVIFTGLYGNHSGQRDEKITSIVSEINTYFVLNLEETGIYLIRNLDGIVFMITSPIFKYLTSEEINLIIEQIEQNNVIFEKNIKIYSATHKNFLEFPTIAFEDVIFQSHKKIIQDDKDNKIINCLKEIIVQLDQ